MHARMGFVLGAILLLLPVGAFAQSDCSPLDAMTESMLPLGLQNKLLAHKIGADDLELTAPPAVGRDVVMLRKSLDVVTQAFFRCEAKSDSSPASLQSGLAVFLHSERSKRGDNSPDVYGSNLAVHVEDAKGFPNSVFVTLTFGIECGDDNLLLLFTKEDGHWKERLHWYADKYTAPSDAFGDFFLYTAVRGPANQPLVAVAHGTPWCSSRMSAFHVDLLLPSDAGRNQSLLAHVDEGYSRDDHIPSVLKGTDDGFQLRAWDDSLDFDSLFTRPRIYRFRTTGGSLVRIQPIAENARDFVDAWLQAPWKDSSQWALEPTATLRKVRDRFEYSLHPNGIPHVSYGPVHACASGSDHFQIEIDLLDIGQVNGKPEEQDLPTLYAQVRQNQNSFTMLAISEKPDASCTGPDLMKKGK